MGVAGLVGAINGVGDHRLAAQVQARDVGGDLGHARMVLGEIVDEQRAGGRIFVDDRLQRRTLGALVGEDAGIDPDLGELFGARIAVVVDEVRQDHHVGLLGKRIDPLDRADDGHLRVHLVVEEEAQHLPDIGRGEQLAALLPAQRFGEIVAFEVEADALARLQPVLEGRDHVQQHFVAVGDYQGAGHCCRASLAAISSSGVTARASAARSRSGS